MNDLTRLLFAAMCFGAVPACVCFVYAGASWYDARRITARYARRYAMQAVRDRFIIAGALLVVGPAIGAALVAGVAVGMPFLLM